MFFSYLDCCLSITPGTGIVGFGPNGGLVRLIRPLGLAGAVFFIAPHYPTRLRRVRLQSRGDVNFHFTPPSSVLFCLVFALLMRVSSQFWTAREILVSANPAVSALSAPSAS